MSKQQAFCCVTWESLAPELAEAKLEELNKLQVPASLTAQVRKVLNQMDQFCPVCGYSFKAITRQNVEDIKNNDNPVPIQSDKGPCPDCKGAGTKGIDENDIPYVCGTCLGQKTWNASNDASVRNYLGSIAPTRARK